MSALRSPVMVGRDSELSWALQRVAEAQDGHGCLIVVTGEPGVGKSRLLAEFTTRARQQGALVLTGHGVDLAGGELAFGALTETLRDLVRQLGVEQVRRLGGRAVQDLASIVPALGGEGTLDRVRVLGATLTLLDALAGTGLVVWVMEDLQWVDAPSRDAFAIAARAVVDRPQLLVASVRTGQAEPPPPPATSAAVADLGALPTAHVLSLGRLDDESARAQIAGIGRSGTTPELVERIVVLAEGLPLHIERLVASLDYADRPLPLSVRELVLSRLPRLSAPARALLEAASLAQGRLPLPLVREVTGLAPDEFDRAVDEAVAVGVVDVIDDGNSLVFVHALLREAIDSSLLPTRRRQLHQAWATALESRLARDPSLVVRVARHWHEAGDAERALTATCLAARRAADVGDAPLETSLWHRAAELWDDVLDAEAVTGLSRDELLYNFSVATSSSADWARLEGLTRRLLGRSGSQEDEVGRVWLSICHEAAQQRLGTLGTPPSRETTRRRAAILLQSGEDYRAVDALHRNAARSRRFDPKLAAEQHRAALSISEHLGNAKARLRASVFVGFDHEARWRPREEATRLAALGEQFRTAMVADRLMIAGLEVSVLAGGGYYRDAVVRGEQALALLQEPRLLPIRFAAIAEPLASAHVALGHWPEAERLLCMIDEEFPGHDAFCDSLRLRVLVRRGESTGLTDLIDRVVAAFGPGHDVVSDEPYFQDLVQALYHLGRSTEARALFQALLGQPHLWWASAIWPAINAALRAELGSVVGPRGRDAQSWSFIERTDQMCRGLRLEGPAGDAHRAEHGARMARLRGQDSVQGWTRAVDEWQRAGAVWDEATCRLRLAEALVTTGDRDSAAVQTAAVLDTAGRLGARPLQEEAIAVARRARLPLTAGARLTGSAGLTPREREVLELVAAGRSNAQIAAELFMSPKTASVHVSRILAKLQAGNRTEAVAIARRVFLLD